jgi:hypothetical protein
MKAWDIYTWEFSFGKHPVVIVSHPDRVSRKPDVNVLKCSSKRAARAPEPNELILDEADGLDWPTLCACDLMFAVDKAELKERRGSVTPARRRAIVSRVIQSFAWNEL